MKLLDPISRIMTSNIVKLNLSDQLTKAEDLFNKYKIRHLPVVDGKEVVGMLSYRDLQKVSFTDEALDENLPMESVVYNSFTLEQVMSKQIISVFPWTPIREATKILAENNFNALPVVDNGNLVGIVTSVDLLKYFYSQYSE